MQILTGNARLLAASFWIPAIDHTQTPWTASSRTVPQVSWSDGLVVGHLLAEVGEDAQLGVEARVGGLEGGAPVGGQVIPTYSMITCTR
jgi:hypothetical protein